MKKPKKVSSNSKIKKLHRKYSAKAINHVRGASSNAKVLIAKKRPKILGKKQENTIEQAIQTIPRITNETVAEHREEVLGSARKYIYPLKHPTHKIVGISVSLFVAVVILFFSYSVLALYKFQSTSGFIYAVTQVMPFPVAKAGGSFVSYENYLFELRHYIHYYQTQQKVDFSSLSGEQQLNQFRKQALNEVVDNAFVDQLASENNVTITNQDLNNEIALLQQQNRLGSNNQVFTAVLKEFWGWSINDFKRELKQQMLAQAVTSKLDVAAHVQANNVLSQLQHGVSFAALAKQYSNDTSTSGNGGAYGFAINRNNRDIPPQVVNELFSLKQGEYSGIIDTGAGLEIVETTGISGSQVEGSHIFIGFNSIDNYINPLKAKEGVNLFISPK